MSKQTNKQRIKPHDNKMAKVATKKKINMKSGKYHHLKDVRKQNLPEKTPFLRQITFCKIMFYQCYALANCNDQQLFSMTNTKIL